MGVVGATAITARIARSYKSLVRKTQLESWAIEGDSPVFESERTSVDFPSSAVHVKHRMNLPGPSGKAKYCL